MITNTRQEDQVRKLLQEKGVLRTREALEHGIHHETLQRMVEKRSIRRIVRGQYILSEHELTEKVSLAMVSKHAPNGVICLLSALRYYEIGTQNPHQIWLALGQKQWAPQIKYPPIRVMSYSDRTLSEGVEEVTLEGVTVKIFNIPKTVVDCFKYRNKVGIDVAIEALRDVIGRGLCKINAFTPYAKTARVQRVMRPYIEALIE